MLFSLDPSALSDLEAKILCFILSSGSTPESVVEDSRFIHIRLPHIGTVHARHYAPDLETCIRLCEWAGHNRFVSDAAFHHALDKRNYCAFRRKVYV